MGADTSLPAWRQKMTAGFREHRPCLPAPPSPPPTLPNGSVALSSSTNGRAQRGLCVSFHPQTTPSVSSCSSAGGRELTKSKDCLNTVRLWRRGADCSSVFPWTLSSPYTLSNRTDRQTDRQSARRADDHHPVIEAVHSAIRRPAFGPIHRARFGPLLVPARIWRDNANICLSDCGEKGAGHESKPIVWHCEVKSLLARRAIPVSCYSFAHARLRLHGIATRTRKLNSCVM